MQNGNRLFNIPFTTYATVTGLLTAIFGLLIIIAWQHDIAFLKTFRLGETAITANLAACFLLSGLSLILLQFSRPSARILVRVISITIIIIALLTILEIVFSVNFGIDEIFFRNFFPSGTIFGKTRMALTSAISAVLTAFILLFLSLKNIRLTFFIVFCFVLILSINIIGLIVLEFHLDDISKVTGFTSMSVVATLLFLNMFLGLFFTFFSKVPFKILIDQTFFAGVVFLISFILLITRLSGSERRSARESNEKEDNTQIAKNYLNHLVEDVFDIETGVRGYLIINNGDYLAPIKTTRTDLPVSIHELSSFFQGNKIQKARIDTLNQLIMSEIVHSELIVSIIKSEGESAAKSLFQKGKGKILTDSIRGLVNKIKAEENQNLKTVNYRENQFSIVSQRITVINVIIQMTLLIVIFYFFRRDINQRRKRIKEVQMLNEELENKVADRTASLAKREESYRELIEQASDGIFISDDKERYLDVNTAGCSMLGYTRAEILQKTLHDLTYATQDEPIRLDELRTGKSLLSEREMIRKDGSHIQVEISAKQLANGNFQGIVRDITERKKAEEAIIASEIRYRRLFESAKDGILILDAESGMIVDVNPFLVELLGYSAEQFHVRKIWDIGIFKDIIANKENFLELQQKKYIRYDDLPLKTSDGREITVEFVSNVYLVNNHKVIQCNIRDITERKQAKEELKKSEEKYRSIFENVQDVYYETSFDGIVSEVSPSIEIISKGQYHRSDLIGRSMSEIYADIKVRDTIIAMLLENGYATDFEVPLKNRDGSFIFCSISAKIIFNAEGRPEKIIGSMHDISERKQSETFIKSLNESLELKIEERTKQLSDANKQLQVEIEERKRVQDQFRIIVESAPNAIIVTDSDGIITLVNSETESYFGYTRSELVGMKVDRLVPNEKKVGHSDLRSNFMSHPKTRNMAVNTELFGLRKDGSKIPILVGLSPIIFNNNTFILASIIDITFRKQAVDALRESEERLHLAANAGNIGIWDWDIVKNELRWDDSMYSLYNISRDDFKGDYEAWIKTLHQDDKKFVDEEIQAALSGERQYAPEFRIVRTNGEVRFIKADSRTFRNENGKAMRMVGINIDITEQKQAIIDIKAAKTEAENANKAKSEFLANMSHEIRTPMNAVLGYTELLGNTRVDQIQKDYINSIKSSGRSLLTLINDILDLSKIEAGKLELEYDFIDTYSFFSEFEKIFSLKVSEKGIKFILDIASGTPHGIYIDEARVRQIVFNLIGNAIKFTSEGQITLKVFIENPQVVNYSKEKSEELIDLIIEVIDTGIGISKELQEAIFEPFVQERDYKNYGGTGLGLAITRRLTMLMNGTINLKSELGKGTTFTVRIPEITYKRDFSGTNIDIQIDPAEIIFEEAVILIADDVEHNRSYLKDALKNTNLKIFEAEDGFDAYQLAKKIVPDLIIADIRMPKMDGFELLNKIKTNKKLKHIPVIAYSASVLKAQKERIHNSEFVGLLIKPVKVTELYLELMNILSYSSTKVSEPEKTLSEVDLIGEINDLPALIHILDTSLYATWKTFAVTQPIGGIRDFGRNLVQLGTDHNSSIIKDYGRELIIAADSYNIDAMLKLIGKYPGIIENLKDSSKNKNND